MYIDVNEIIKLRDSLPECTMCGGDAWKYGTLWAHGYPYVAYHCVKCGRKTPIMHIEGWKMLFKNYYPDKYPEVFSEDPKPILDMDKVFLP